MRDNYMYNEVVNNVVGGGSLELVVQSVAGVLLSEGPVTFKDFLADKNKWESPIKSPENAESVLQSENGWFYVKTKEVKDGSPQYVYKGDGEKKEIPKDTTLKIVKVEKVGDRLRGQIELLIFYSMGIVNIYSLGRGRRLLVNIL